MDISGKETTNATRSLPVIPRHEQEQQKYEDLKSKIVSMSRTLEEAQLELNNLLGDMFRAVRVFSNAITIRWRLIGSGEKKLVDRWQRNDYSQENRLEQFGQVRHYAKSRASGQMSRRRGQEERSSQTDNIDMEQAENVQDWISDKISKQDVFDDIEGEDNNHRKWLVHRILQRKYFKPPQQTNVLTWSAKEQIRYLNAEYPEEWTPERLAASFSLSVDGVRRLLRSTFVPRDQKEIADHDRRALANLEKLGISRNTAKLQPAVGSEKPPVARVKQISDGSKDVKVSPGIFASLLSKKVEKELNSKLLASRDSFMKTNMVDETTGHRKSSKVQRDGPEIILSHDNSTASDNNMVDETTGHRKSSRVQRDGPEIILSHDNSTASDNNCDGLDWSERYLSVAGNSHRYNVPDSQDRPKRSLRRRLRNPDSTASLTTSSSFDREEYAMKGTKKLVRDIENKRENVEEKARQNAHLLRAKPSMSLEDLEKQRTPDVRYDEELYIYDEDKGYQYPYGRHMDLPIDKLAVDKDLDHSKTKPARSGLGLHKKGNDFFDDDGEFLFRVP